MRAMVGFVMYLPEIMWSEGACSRRLNELLSLLSMQDALLCYARYETDNGQFVVPPNFVCCFWGANTLLLTRLFVCFVIPTKIDLEC